MDARTDFRAALIEDRSCPDCLGRLDRNRVCKKCRRDVTQEWVAYWKRLDRELCDLEMAEE